jgi:WD40 repeat protein
VVGGGARGRRLLVCVGVGQYRHRQDVADLPQVREDVRRVTSLFTDFGFASALPGLGEYASVGHVRQALSHWCRDAALGREDTVVLYYAGHGHTEEGDRHYLLCWDSQPDDLATSALPAEDLVRILARTEMGNLLVILDTCHAGRGAADAARVAVRTLGRRWAEATSRTGLWLLSAARSADEAADGAFGALLAPAVATATGRAGQRQRYIDLAELVDVLNQLFEHRGLAQRAELTASLVTGLAPFIPNREYRAYLPPAGTDLETQRLAAKRDLVEHFGPRARGVDFESEQGLYFSGRRRALRELVAWLTGPRTGGRGRVVTGDPGCGKSAVLGRIVAMSHPAYRQGLNLSGVDPDLVVPAGCVDAAVHARHKRLEDMVRQIAGELGMAVEGTGELLQELSRRSRAGRSQVIVVDALDEAGTGTAADTGSRGEPRRIARELLRPLSEVPGLKLLVGTRRDLLGALGPAMTVLDLDRAGYLGDDDIAGYVRAVLLADGQPEVATPYRDRPDLAREVADAAAARACGVFLVARMTARSLRAAPGPVDVTQPGWEQDLPSEVGEAFDDYLARFGDDEERVRRMLAPLAFAEGRGLPRGDLWTRLAEVFTGAPCTDDDIGTLLRAAASYVAEVPDAQGRSVYRLYHAALAEHLRADPRFPARSTQRRIVDCLTAAVPRLAPGGEVLDWWQAPHYVRAHLATHAAAGACLDELVDDPGFLLAAEQLGLLRALPDVTSPTTECARNAYEQVAHRLRPGRPLRERAAELQLSARRCGAAGLADRVDHLGLDPPWSARWTWWSPTGTHRQLVGHTDGVTAVAAGDLDGRPIAVTGGADGAVRVWDLLTQEPVGPPLAVDEDEVKTVALGELDDYSVVLAGGAGGAVRVFDLSTLQEIRTPLRGHTNAVTSVAAGNPGGRPVAVTGSSDGTARLWDLHTGEQLGGPLTGHRSGVTAVALGALDDQPVVVTGGGDNRVYVWDLASRERVRTLIGHTRGITAVALGELGGRPIVVTASQDSSFGRWDLRTGQQLGEPLGAGHRPVNDAALGRVGSRQVVVTCDRVGAYLWDLTTGQPLGRPLTGHAGAVNAVALGSVSGRTMIITGGDDGTARLWDVTADRPETGHTRYVTVMAVGGVRGEPAVVTGSADTTARLWSLTTGRPLAPPLVGHSQEVTAAVLGDVRGRAVVVTGSSDCELRVWDARSGRQIGEPLTGHTAGVTAVTIAEVDGRTVAVSGSADGTIRLWSPESGSAAGEPLIGHNADVKYLAVFPLGGRPAAVAVSRRGSAYLWPSVVSTAGRRLPGIPDKSTPIAGGVVGGTPMVLIRRRDQSLLLWDLIAGAPAGEPILDAPGDAYEACITEYEGRAIGLTISFQGILHTWDLRSASSPCPPIFVNQGIATPALAQSAGRLVGVTSHGQAVRRWDLLRTVPLGEALGGQEMRLSSLALHSDGKGGRPFAATAGVDALIRIIDTRTGSALRPPIPVHGRATSVAVVTIDRKDVVVVGEDRSESGRSVSLYDMESGLRAWSVTVPTEYPWTSQLKLAVMRDGGRMLAAWSQERSVQVWDLSARTPLVELTGHTGKIMAVAIACLGDRTVVATGARDGTARLWDVATGELLTRFAGHGGDVNVVVIGQIADYPILATGDDDGAVRIWDLASERPVDHGIPAHDSWISAIDLVTADGRTLCAVGYADGQVRIWNLKSRDEVAEIHLASDVTDLAMTPAGGLYVTTESGLAAFHLAINEDSSVDLLQEST